MAGQNVKWAIVGCGGMGRRHLRGGAVLAKSSFSNYELVAVCDRDAGRRQQMVADAEELFGYRPDTYDDAREMLDAHPEIEAVDVVTDMRSHHDLSVMCLERGVCVLSEKPIAVTVAEGRSIIAAAERSGTVFGVAENFPRFPANKLAAALVRDGAIGTPRLMREARIWGRDEIQQAAWRHMRESGSVPIDTGVHYTSIFRLFFGDPVSIYGKAKLREKTRRNVGWKDAEGNIWADTAAPDTIEATADDAIYALIDYPAEVVVEWVFDYAGHGRPAFERQVFGSRGSLEIPRDRSGEAVRLFLDDDQVIDDERILSHAPSYRLDAFDAWLFGGDRVWRHDFSYSETDQKILASQIQGFGTCVREKRPYSMDGIGALRDLATCLGVFESSTAGRPVAFEEVFDGRLAAYQRIFDRRPS